MHDPWADGSILRPLYPQSCTFLMIAQCYWHSFNSVFSSFSPFLYSLLHFSPFLCCPFLISPFFKHLFDHLFGSPVPLHCTACHPGLNYFKCSFDPPLSKNMIFRLFCKPDPTPPSSGYPDTLLPATFIWFEFPTCTPTHSMAGYRSYA